MNRRSPQATRGLEGSTSCGRSVSTRDRYRCRTGRGGTAWRGIGARLINSPSTLRPAPDAAGHERKKSALMLEDMGCIVEKVDRFFDEDPARLWTAKFYAGVGTRLRNTLKTKREMLDPAVSDILDAALSQTMRDDYESVFARHAFYRAALKKFDDYDAVLSPVIPVSSLDDRRNPSRLAAVQRQRRHAAFRRDERAGRPGVNDSLKSSRSPRRLVKD